MIKILPFSEEHLKDFRPRDIFAPDVLDIIRASRDMKFTVYAGDKVLAVLGITHIHPTMSEIWSVTAPEQEVRKNRRAYLRVLKTALNAYMENSDVRRLQVLIPNTFGTAEKWGRALGFTLEGTLRNYGWNCEDYFMFARYK